MKFQFFFSLNTKRSPKSTVQVHLYFNVVVGGGGSVA